MTRDADAPPDDPLAALPPRRLAAIARRADRLRRANLAAFEALAAVTGVEPRRLRLLADAWNAAGRSGVAALRPPSDRADVAAEAVVAALEAWRRRSLPLEALRWDLWRNRVTVWRAVPPEDRTGPAVEAALLQLRRTDDGGWHLYRRAAQDEWWPVRVGTRRRGSSLAACLDAVLSDPAGQFLRQAE